MDKKYILRSGIRTAKWSRLAAKAVDLFIILVLSTTLYPMGPILGIVYISLSDSMQMGQSVGKKMVGFAVVSLIDGQPCSTKQSVIRNLPIIFPLIFAIIPFWGLIFTVILGVPLLALEAYFVLSIASGHRLGDVMADTTVIANDPNRVDLQKSKKLSWFDQNEPSSSVSKL